MAALLQPPSTMLDVIVVGGGPAGLSAALMLGRCRRRVLVCDAGAPRNAASRALHGFLSRDGMAPAELLRVGREELKPYGVETRAASVTSVCPTEEGFEVTLGDGSLLRSRKLLLATGVVDKLPAIDGIDACYGRSVFHCPYCDGWEVRDQPLAVYGQGKDGATLSLALLAWSHDIVLCSNGRARLARRERSHLERHQIPVYEGAIARLEHDAGALQRIVFRDGAAIAREALFFTTGQRNRSELASKLGCVFTRKGVVKTGNLGESGVPGLYVAGDASRDVQFAVVAAAEGAKVAYAINKELQSEAR